MSAKAVRPVIEEFLKALEAVGGVPGYKALSEQLRALGERLETKVRDLTYIVLTGPTGCGKSKLTNTVFRRALSPVGYRRPTTFTPHVITPAPAASAVSASLPALPFELIELDGQASEPFVLIDTPDIDSVRVENRSLAEAFLRFADAVVIVVDPEKYADRSVWSFLRRFKREGLTFAVVFNKAREKEPVSDFRSKLKAEGMPEEIVVVPFTAGMDHELLPESPGIEALRRRFAAWGSSNEVRLSAHRRSLENGRSAVKERVLPFLRQAEDKARELLGNIESILERKTAQLKEGVPFSLDRKTAAAVYSQLLAHLERVDPLRLPRRILSAPFRYVRDKLGFRPTPPTEAPELRRLRELREEGFLTAAAELFLDLEEAMRNGGFTPPEPPSEQQIRQRFRAFNERFQEEVRAQAEVLAGTLTPAQQVRFYLVQALVLGTMLGFELHTGGVLTVTEVLTGGLLSPFAAKLVGMALSAEESRRFHSRMRELYHKGLGELLRELAQTPADSVRKQVEKVQVAQKRAQKFLETLDSVEAPGL